MKSYLILDVIEKKQADTAWWKTKWIYASAMTWNDSVSCACCQPKEEDEMWMWNDWLICVLLISILLNKFVSRWTCSCRYKGLVFSVELEYIGQFLCLGIRMFLCLRTLVSLIQCADEWIKWWQVMRILHFLVSYSRPYLCVQIKLSETFWKATFVH